MTVAGGKPRPQDEAHPPVAPPKLPRAPAGRMTNGSLNAFTRPGEAHRPPHQIRWVRLVPPSFPPATFFRASSAMTPDVSIPPCPCAFYTSTRMSENGMTPAVMDHFLNPRNVGDSADADGRERTPICSLVGRVVSG